MCTHTDRDMRCVDPQDITIHIHVVWLQARGYKNLFPAYLWARLNSADLERGIAPRSDIKIVLSHGWPISS